jgi:hypothetical protein
MTVAKTMADFNQLLKDGHELSLEVIDRDIAKQMSYIDCIRELACGTVTQDQWGNRTYDQNSYLYAQIRLREFIQTKSIALGNSIEFDGSRVLITMNPEQVSLSGDAHFASYVKSTIAFDANGVAIVSGGFLMVKNEDLDQLHQDLAREYSEVELDDAVKHARLQKAGRQILVSFRKIMAGEKPTVVENPFNFK